MYRHKKNMLLRRSGAEAEAQDRPLLQVEGTMCGINQILINLVQAPGRSILFIKLESLLTVHKLNRFSAARHVCGSQRRMAVNQSLKSPLQGCRV